MSLPVVASLARVLAARDELPPEKRKGPLLESPEVWVELACGTKESAFHEMAAHAIAASRGGGPPHRLRLRLSEEARSAFRRARIVAMWRAKKQLTEGEALGEFSEHYLDTFDPLRRGTAPRRLGDTQKIKLDRYIAAEVRRAVIARDVVSRDHGACRVPLCEHNLYLEFAHIVPHRDGGCREVANILLMCALHNHLHETGALQIRGDANNPIFLDREQRIHIPYLYGKPGPPLEAWIRKLEQKGDRLRSPTGAEIEEPYREMQREAPGAWP
jgi:hypothetical protein